MQLMAKAMSCKVGNPLRKLVLIKLADNANDKGECWPSYQHVADQCECSKSAVKSHITALIDMGFLSKENRIGENSGKGNKSNVYYLTLDNPVVPESTAPVPSKSIGMSPCDPPVVPESTAPVPSKSTRTYHSSEPVNEPVIEPKTHGARDGNYSEQFELCWKAYPKREGSNPKNHAFKHFQARVKEGVSPDDLLAGTRRYAAFCAAKGQVGTPYVMQAQRFYGTSREFENSWEVSTTPAPAPRQQKPADTTQDMLARQYQGGGVNWKFRGESR
ncbi:helix-turn-helix domain-containing protein [Dickeya dadantii]|uniref:helix-turn-helix domain-containing protein n=1 Tax=Dickeya dadantii TaxID=204038 RepID=UPI00039AC6CF|nr:helix-turn-helix domain-containing protein [Dickeya dadantii]